MTTTQRQAWLAERRKHICASDIAAIIGLAGRRTALNVYLSKIEGIEQEETDYMRAGRAVEGGIIELYRDERKRADIERNAELIVHPTYSFIAATPDALVGNDGLVEAKFTSLRIEEPSAAHLAQLQWQLYATDRQWGSLAYLTCGKFLTFDFDRDETLIEKLHNAAFAFWTDHIETRTPPEPTTPDDAALLFRNHIDGKIIEATKETAHLVNRYRTLKQTQSALTDELNEAQTQLKALMGEAEAIVIEGEKIVTWRKSRDGEAFDEKRFRTEHEDLYRQYVATKDGSRRFVVR